MFNIAFNFLIAIALDPATIGLIALGAVCAVLAIMLLVEHVKRKNAQKRAELLMAEAASRPEVLPIDPTDNAGAIHTIRETDPTEIEFDPRIDPSPMGVLVRHEAPEDEDNDVPTPTAPAPEPRNNRYENRLIIEETPAYATPRPTRVSEPEEDDEELFANRNVYPEDMLLIGEEDIDEAEIVLVPKPPKKKKEPKPKKKKKTKGFFNSLIIEESYEPIMSTAPTSAPIAEAPVVEEPKPEPEAVAEPIAQSESQTPSALSGVADTLTGIASAFSSIANIGNRASAEADTAEAPKPEQKPKPAQSKPKPAQSKPKPASTLEENPRAAVEQLARSGARYADPEDMFERAPYTRPVNIEHNPNAFASTVSVPARMELSMNERSSQNPPMFISIGESKPNDRTLPTAQREGDVNLQIFLNSNIEAELENERRAVADAERQARAAEQRANSYVVENTTAPNLEYDVSSANTASRDAFTVETAPAPTVVVEQTPIHTIDATTEILNTQPSPEHTNEAPEIAETAEQAAAAPQASGLRQVLVVEETPAIARTTTAAPQQHAADNTATEAAEDGAAYLINGEVVQVRYRSSFMSRLIQASPEVQDYYTVLKNEILAYNGVKVKESWNYESFNREGEQCIKLNVRGRSVMVYLALNPADYLNTKYRFKDMSNTPKFEKVPMLLSVRTERGLKYAIELISEVMKKFGAARGELPNVDYHMPYETNAELVLRRLVKLILPDGVTVDRSSEIVPVNVGDYINGATGRS